MAALALWATPRTVSTAFDKMMRARADHTVLTEPFSVPWYHGPEQRSTRYEVSEPGATFAATLEAVTSTAAPVFVKDMAYQLGPLLEADVLARFRNSFIVRDPAWAIPSLLRRWPDATEVEAGYGAQLAAFRLCRDVLGHAPPVIDSDQLRTDPDGVVARWCAAVGIEHRPDALTWAPGMPAGWERWADWYETAAASTRFEPPEHREPPRATGHAATLIDRSRAAYEELVSHRL